MLPETIEWISETPMLRLLDQRKIPASVGFVLCRTYEETAGAIEDMTVRGAPAIGVAAAYGVVLAAYHDPSKIDEALFRLSATRPTAVNLFWSIEKMRSVYNEYKNSPELYLRLESEAVKIDKEDRSINRMIGVNGAGILPDRAAVITHCNAGALATAGYGTALGVFRAAREAGKKLRIYADETRPRFQGGRLTAFELCEDGFDVTVICDSMSAFLMSREKIDAVITGADRIALNGDTANKIGTYGLAISAQKHNVPFYIAAPISTIDFNCPNGTSIPIEERDHSEVKRLGSEILVDERAKVWNPAFDVTPADLIKGIITEAGIFEPPRIKELNDRY
ncbi:MAG: S-methyl-5-thioribose-1-phosphate isomerase [Synergistaceae bacterium]|nr:S-methyl-5-thioribose-1-phosphate isomerase [Synergistaceae bacterium]